MTTKIMIVGEGPQDYGNDSGYEGDIVLFLRKIVSTLSKKKLHFEPIPQDVKEVKFHMHRQKGENMPSLARRIRQFIKIANEKSLDALVVLIDDRLEEKKPRIDQLRQGREDAQKEGISFPTALGTAIKEIEAWILGDAEAQIYGLGEKIGRRRLPSDPENMDDPKSEFSKRYGEYRQSLETSGQFDIPDEDSCKKTIIAQIDIDRLSTLCPQGFQPFIEEVKSQIMPVFEGKKTKGSLDACVKSV